MFVYRKVRLGYLLSCNVSHVIISRSTGFNVALFTGDQFVSLCYEVACGDDKVGSGVKKYSVPCVITIVRHNTVV
jgi:hypothetical protein